MPTTTPTRPPDSGAEQIEIHVKITQRRLPPTIPWVAREPVRLVVDEPDPSVSSGDGDGGQNQAGR